MPEYEREMGQIEQRLDGIKETLSESKNSMEQFAKEVRTFMNESKMDRLEISNQISTVDGKIDSHLTAHHRFFWNVGFAVTGIVGVSELLVNLGNIMRWLRGG